MVVHIRDSKIELEQLFIKEICYREICKTLKVKNEYNALETRNHAYFLYVALVNG